MDYDIIGDVHGHVEPLRALLAHLGYRETAGAWRHPARQAIFVGDFIDRGPGQVDTVRLVRAMVDAGSAQAVMGNHEFNAIAWHTPDPDAPGEYLRRRSGEIGAKNLQQHERFLAEVEDPQQHRDVIEWFLSLPLWLELPELRVVHACWHEEYMKELEPRLTSNRQLTMDAVVAASRPGSVEFRTAVGLTKGIEVPLPADHAFRDKDGHERRSVRVKWWESEATTFRSLALMPDEDLKRVPDLPLPRWARFGCRPDKPVFFGHYWLQGAPAPVSAHAACVDYSVAKGGKLVAYRLDAGEPLTPAGFAWVGA
jgi:hypothetical protein